MLILIMVDILPEVGVDLQVFSLVVEVLAMDTALRGRRLAIPSAKHLQHAAMLSS